MGPVERDGAGGGGGDGVARAGHGRGTEIKRTRGNRTRARPGEGAKEAIRGKASIECGLFVYRAKVQQCLDSYLASELSAQGNIRTASPQFPMRLLFG
jgi:hypothetical protein